MADDIFGDASLFSEFERDREQQNIFINFDLDESGCENRSRIVFRNAESEDESSEDEDFQCDTESSRNGEAPLAPAATQDSSDAIAPNTESEETKQEPVDDYTTNGFTKNNDDQQTTSYQERFERNKFRQFAKLIDSTRCVSDEQSPGVQVVFHNNKFARKYRARIEQFIVSLTEHADQRDFSKPPSDLITRVTMPSCVDINNKLPPEKRTNLMWQTHAIVGCAQFHLGFMVDSHGFPLDAQEPMHMINWEVPKFFQVFDELYPPDEVDSDSQSKPPAPSKEACFNCGGDHRLSECKVVRDQSRIRAKRREHQEKMGNTRNKSHSARYHKDPELDPTKTKFKAGEISNSLREAMSLRPEQLPLYIYRMRLYGYPPGWLQEANKRGASLAMYDKDGNETNLRGESLEDGEVGTDNSPDPSDTEAFDLEKIIEYPGFTVPVPLGFIDESAAIGMPHIQQHQLKRTLKDDIHAKETSRKRKMEEEESSIAKRVKETVEDMDLEDEDQAPLPTITSTPSEAKEASGAGDVESPQSPTMDALLQQQQQLVQELKSENGDASSDVNEDSNAASPASSPSGFDSKHTSDPDYLRQQNFSFTSSLSVSKDYGTPILVRESSYKKLPSDVKFSQGIEDHIPYENLPDATGTFDKMRNLFKIIREKVKGVKKK